MHFTLKMLRYYDAALRLGSIARAAEEMWISQSSITAAIDQIEQTLGRELFLRIPAKGIVPTDDGRAVGTQVAKFLDQARLFESELLSLSGDPSGTLHLACYAPTAPFVLPVLLKRLRMIYPAIRVDLKEGDMADIAGQLQTGMVDMVLTYRRSMPVGAPFEPLFRARPFAVLPDTSPLAAQRNVALDDLADLPMILLDLPSTQEYFRGIFSASGLSPNVVHTTKSSSVLRGLVAAGFGYSILNIYGHGDRDGLAGYVARPIVGPVDEPQFGIAYSSATRRSAMVQAVLKIAAQLSHEHAFDPLILRPD